MVITTTTVLLVLCHALIEGLGGTVWRSQAVVFRRLHGLPAAPIDRATHQVDRATHQSTAGRALRDRASLCTILGSGAGERPVYADTGSRPQGRP